MSWTDDDVLLLLLLGALVLLLLLLTAVGFTLGYRIAEICLESRQTAHVEHVVRNFVHPNKPPAAYPSDAETATDDGRVENEAAPTPSKTPAGPEIDIVNETAAAATPMPTFRSRLLRVSGRSKTRHTAKRKHRSPSTPRKQPMPVIREDDAASI